ncbi:Tripartite tricarboxylate transporter TctB family protein [Thermanaeromonas toyohensis ToBE]|uniref:Tripartite tricarboxylate transporter TctB family protein n=1 Tax=Thermanaeromonas toyohensis ToBE TaxID=698762 RepID=A0A1W1W2F2_9FIRM|nr:tripartite tricarboxylate transporter TctB family protein [Thermanaeromonas toyohensis]SMB99571.1 Tripartite tricarboxylate transporter TctB family protein [Thermanaeromonas toyohensis ToBE]
MRWERYFAASILIFSLIYTWKSLSLRVGTLAAPGPGFLPLVVGIASAAIATIILINSYIVMNRGKVNRAKEETPAKAEKSDETLTEEDKAKIILFAIGVIIYIIVLETLGYLISTFCLMLYLLRVMRVEGWWRPVILSVVCSVVAYVVFAVWLKVPLPKGILAL